MSRLSVVNALDNTHSDLGGSYLKLLFKVASIFKVLSGQSHRLCFFVCLFLIIILHYRRLVKYNEAIYNFIL